MNSRQKFLAVVACVLLMAVCQHAKADIVVGSEDTAVADPPVRRPGGSPYVITLFSDMEFADWSLKDFAYEPPGQCPGPWEKVVLVGDFRVTDGIQYDRTCQVTIGHVNVYYGTTPEPSPSFGPTWHFERDLTDYSALLSSPQNGQAFLGNIVNSSYTGIIYGTVKLEFYPADPGRNAPDVPDAVIPLHDSGGCAVTLHTGDDSLSRSLELPRNIEKAYLDVFAQSQSGDEFWFTCVPDDLSDLLYSCGATAFRETQVSIDGVPAGVAPVYPWVYTGCVDPNLWAPIPGVQALNFTPYRVDLTPFAALLSDGSAHTVAVKVFNANEWFLADAALLIFQDEGTTQVSGEVTQNTLSSGPDPVITDTIVETDTSITGQVSTTSLRDYVIAGYVITSHGKVKTKVKTRISFSNVQGFTIDEDSYVQDIRQNTLIYSKTTVKKGRNTREETLKMQYPFNMKIAQEQQASGKIFMTTTVDQHHDFKRAKALNGVGGAWSRAENGVATTDTMIFNSFGNYTGHQDQKSSQRYKAKDSKGYCWDRYIESEDGAVKLLTDGCK